MLSEHNEPMSSTRPENRVRDPEPNQRNPDFHSAWGRCAILAATPTSAPIHALTRRPLEHRRLRDRELVAVVDELVEDASLVLYKKLCDLADAGIAPTFDRLLLEFDQPQWKSLIVELDERGRERTSPPTLASWQTLLNRFRDRALARQHRAQTAILRERGLDDAEEKEILQQIVERERNRRRQSLSTDGQ